MAPNRRLALLIDGDNAQAALLPQILDEVRKHGTITIRRVYGDWTAPNMNSWKEIIHKYGLRPNQQFGYTKGKNATDIGLTIGAMDILHGAEVDGFCIVSSDSDYTPLVSRICEQDLFVLGIGKKTTPSSFVEACNDFVFTENLVTVADETPKEAPKPVLAEQKIDDQLVNNVSIPKDLKKLIRAAFEASVQDDGWAYLGEVGSSLRELDPEFSSGPYGGKSLLKLIESYPKFIETYKDTNEKGSGSVYIRLKANPKTPK